MVVPEPETMLQGEVESSLQSNDQHQKNQPFSSLGRQSSIYSLTLDEFQNTMCESGKNFGSMNMDEFLNSIWTAEENQAINSNNTPNSNNNNSYTSGHAAAAAAVDHLAPSEVTAEKGRIAGQPSLTRQGSLTLPSPLCRKTVEEVWSEIHNKGRRQEEQKQHHNSGGGTTTTTTTNNNSTVGDNNARNSDSTPRQPTFGEMTLEDFLIKAGVVREADPLATAPPSQPYGMYHNSSAGAGPSYVNRPATLGIGGGATGTSGGGSGGVPAYQAGTAAFGDSSVYAGKGSYPPAAAAAPAVCYGGRVVNGGGGYAAAAGQVPLGLPAPVSPVSSDGICGNQVENSGSQFGLDMGTLRGRKRIIDGPVEKVVERRQRRMIKNRESAARSRARKQAYTVELEAELNQLREENAHLKQALAELQRKQKQQYFEEMKMKVQTRAYKAKEKLRVFRRNLSCPL